MEVKIHPASGGKPAVVHVKGDMRLGEGRSDRLRSALIEAFEHGRHVVLDLAEVRDIDSQGIGCVARCLATAISHKANLHLVVPAGRVRNALEQVNLLSVFPCHTKMP